ncbi:Single-strand binding protein family protein [Nocardioides alpinus]|uniref:Single-strand binding protein family protein n=1 Tax=Nocardioides alpinus TaxID=748909 RepID=A0A1I1AL75_9ACTN|nr:single-stranded DNA-binding protein [Nocardioides alpinus]PKH41711.1 single-stranded DNA-binding protein [Nocardioides alpinus]SFB38779.1 Single-strand binding protein family protein [Nocardioides alpinus]
MTIPTQMSMHGYIATAPELSFTDKGHARFYCRVGIEQHRKEVDGSFTRLDPVYADLVMFERTAERAYSRFKPGDRIIASGYIHEYEQDRPGQPSEIREQFVARRIGHDCAWTRYVVDRTPAQQLEAPHNEMTVVNEPTPAISL